MIDNQFLNVTSHKSNQMKKLIYLSFISLFVLVSCGGNNDKKDKQNDAESTLEKSVEADEFDTAKDCDEFIDQYEKWMDDYLKLLEKYMKNPMDAALMQKYVEVSQEATSWLEQWTNLAACASNDKYQKRFDAISEKADKKLEELGLD